MQACVWGMCVHMCVDMFEARARGHLGGEGASSAQHRQGDGPASSLGLVSMGKQRAGRSGDLGAVFFKASRLKGQPNSQYTIGSDPRLQRFVRGSDFRRSGCGS